MPRRTLVATPLTRPTVLPIIAPIMPIAPARRILDRIDEQDRPRAVYGRRRATFWHDLGAAPASGIPEAKAYLARIRRRLEYDAPEVHGSCLTTYEYNELKRLSRIWTRRASGLDRAYNVHGAHRGRHLGSPASLTPAERATAKINQSARSLTANLKREHANQTRQARRMSKRLRLGQRLRD